MHEHFHGGCHFERPEHERVHVQIQFNAFQPEHHGCFQRRNENFCHRPSNHLPDVVINFGGNEPPCPPPFERHIPGPPRFYPMPGRNGGGYSFGYAPPEQYDNTAYPVPSDRNQPQYDNCAPEPIDRSQPQYDNGTTAPTDRAQPQYEQPPRRAAQPSPDLSETSYGDDAAATPGRTYGYADAPDACDKTGPAAAPGEGAKTDPDFYDGRRNGEGDITPPPDAAQPRAGDTIPAEGDAPPPGSEIVPIASTPATNDAPVSFSAPTADRSAADQIDDIFDQQALRNAMPTPPELEQQSIEQPQALGPQPEAIVNTPQPTPVEDNKPSNDKPAADTTEGALPDIYGMPDMGKN